MDGKGFEQIRQRVLEARTLEDIASVFIDTFGLGAGMLTFAKALDAVQNGKQANPTKELVRYFENLDSEAAIDEVGEYFRAAFPLWRCNPQGNLPLLVLDRGIGEEIGAKTQIVLLSADTLKKQDEHHPELTQEDYAKAQEAVLKGEKIRQDARNIAFVIDIPGGMAVIVKATLQGEELYMTSLRRLSRKDRKRGMEIRRLKKG